jgi:hypothetical protein
MSKKSKPGFYNVAMFALSITILLMCMGARYTMGDAKFMKECVEVAILAPPIGLNMANFVVKLMLNMGLKLNEDIKNIRLAFKEIKPCEATISINKTHIIIVTTNRGLCRPPHI